MNIDKIKQWVKKNPQLECVYMCIQGVKDKNIAEQIVGTKRNPYYLFIHHYGNLNPDKTIYYILFDENAKYNGFCSLHRQVLMHLAYSEFMMLTPVVCYGENTLYYDESVINCKNAFDYYFESVSQLDEQTVFKSERVIISKGADAAAFGTTDGYSVSEEEINLLGKYQKKYIVLKKDIKKLFWEEMMEIVSGSKTIGVHVRATDYNMGYNRHPVVVTPREYVDKTKKALEVYGYQKVFLATDDEKIVELFKKEFGDLLYYYSSTYRSKDGKAIHYGDQNTDRKYHKFNLGLEIIKDFYTLGYCDGLIAGNSNVSMCARIVKASLEQNYSSLEIIDKGTNHNMRETRSRFHSMLSRKDK